MNDVATNEGKLYDPDKYFPLSRDQKDLREKNQQHFTVKLTEEKGRDFALKVLWSGDYIIIGDKYYHNPIGCKHCAFMDWPNSIKTNQVVCGYERALYGTETGITGKKIKKGKCKNWMPTRVENLKRHAMWFVYANLFGFLFLSTAIVLYLLTIF